MIYERELSGKMRVLRDKLHGRYESQGKVMLIESILGEQEKYNLQDLEERAKL